MHLSRLNLNLFVVLDAIYREGSLTGASNILNLTQPAISHALAKLRDLFDDPLFTRHGNLMVPTPFVRAVIGDVQTALAGFSQVLREGDRFDPVRAEKKFRLGFRDMIEAATLPALLHHFERAAPHCTIDSLHIDRRDFETELLAGSLDLALDVLLPVGAAIRHQPVLTGKALVMARADHPALAGGTEALDLGLYLAQKHILVSSRRKGLGWEDFELSRHGHTRQIAARCQHFFTACRVVSETDLLLTLPAQYVPLVNEPFGNRVFALPFETETLDIYLYWHANADNDPANRWLRQVIQDVMIGTL